MHIPNPNQFNAIHKLLAMPMPIGPMGIGIAQSVLEGFPFHWSLLPFPIGGHDHGAADFCGDHARDGGRDVGCSAPYGAEALGKSKTVAIVVVGNASFTSSSSSSG